MKALRFARTHSVAILGCLLLAACLLAMAACSPSAALATGSMLGLGAMYQFSVGEQSVQLDTDDDNSITSFERRLSAAHERETEGRLEAQQEAHDATVEALEGEVETLQQVAVDETLRLRQLSRGDGLDAESERAYLEGLSAERLQRELDHAREEAKTLSTTGAQLGEGDKGDPTGEGENAFMPGAKSNG